MQLSDIIFESNILSRHCHICLLSVLGSSHSLSSSEPEPAAIMRSQTIWSQSCNSSLALLIYSLAHMASSLELSCGNTNGLRSGIHLQLLGFRTGTGKPAVLFKRVPWVQCWFLPHHDTPHTRAVVSWVCTGLLWYIYPQFLYFKLCFLSFFIIFFLHVTL